VLGKRNKVRITLTQKIRDEKCFPYRFCLGVFLSGPHHLLGLQYYFFCGCKCKIRIFSINKFGVGCFFTGPCGVKASFSGNRIGIAARFTVVMFEKKIVDVTHRYSATVFFDLCRTACGTLFWLWIDVSKQLLQEKATKQS
jgi:hypothetical protein